MKQVLHTYNIGDIVVPHFKTVTYHATDLKYIQVMEITKFLTNHLLEVTIHSLIDGKDFITIPAGNFIDLIPCNSNTKRFTFKVGDKIRILRKNVVLQHKIKTKNRRFFWLEQMKKYL